MTFSAFFTVNFAWSAAEWSVFFTPANSELAESLIVFLRLTGGGGPGNGPTRRAEEEEEVGRDGEGGTEDGPDFLGVADLGRGKAEESIERGGEEREETEDRGDEEERLEAVEEDLTGPVAAVDDSGSPKNWLINSGLEAIDERGTTEEESGYNPGWDWEREVESREGSESGSETGAGDREDEGDEGSQATVEEVKRSGTGREGEVEDIK
jgi:hypothetical protein